MIKIDHGLHKQNSFCFGNPAIPEGPVAFRPTITRGLALSAICDIKIIIELKARLMPMMVCL